MNPKIFENRAKFHSLPLDFQYQDSTGYKSNFEYIKDKFSNYHFDKWKQDQEGEYFSRLGRYDWNDEDKKSLLDLYPFLIEESKKIGWNELTDKQAHPGFPGGKSPLLEQEHYDRKEFGGIEFTQVVPEPLIADHSVLKKMTDYWRLKRCRTRIHTQFPGQTFPMHIDKLWHRYPAAPHKVTRLVVTLQDYEPGQVMVYGNYVYTNWRAGDVHIFDTLNVPHSAVNMSRSPRIIFVITGVRTDETDKILIESTYDSLHKI